MGRDDDYRSAGKPVCDYDDAAAREALVHALAKDARALLGALDGRELSAAVRQAAALLASVAGQDHDEGEDGIFRIARRVAKDRIISTVDPEARHGHKTAARGFDGYKGHVAIDPDSELITATEVTAGNVGDAAAAPDLLADDLPDIDEPAAADEPAVDTEPAAAAGQPVAVDEAASDEPAAAADERDDANGPATAGHADSDDSKQRLAVYGDCAYGAGALLDILEHADADVMCKVQPPVAPDGRYAKDRFDIDLQAGTVTCPAGHVAPLPKQTDGQIARFGAACAGCPLAARCTTSTKGRTIHVGPHEAQLTRARQRQSDPAWKADYTTTRPKVERKIAHLMRRKHGGRCARVRGQTKTAADFKLLAGAVNLARLAALGLTHQDGAWAANTA